jgi:hypothetical protein
MLGAFSLLESEQQGASSFLDPVQQGDLSLGCSFDWLIVILLIVGFVSLCLNLVRQLTSQKSPASIGSITG